MKKIIKNKTRFLQLTVPLFPVLLPGQEIAGDTVRLRPNHSLNLKEMRNILEQNTLATFKIQDEPWSLVSVYSPYSPDYHVMLMESSNRYLPSPEWIPDNEGNALMDLWSHILKFIALKKNTDTFYVGYNWSPRSWGEKEERGGFQSIPTKWHAMLWSWPSFPELNKKTPYAQWISKNDLSPRAQRIFCCNDYIQPLSQEIIHSFQKHGEISLLPPFSNWSYDERGIVITLNQSLSDLTDTSNFFSKGLKPLAVRLNQFFCELTEAFTDINCSKMDNLLKQIEKRELSIEEIETLRAPPKLKSIQEIQKNFQEIKWSNELLEVLIEPVKNRCLEKGNPHSWWRKGFGYALVFKNLKNERSCELRIMPGVYLGPGGVVEAQGVVLKRPTDQFISEGEIKQKSSLLWDLNTYLKEHFEEFK